ncbi:MAG: nucleotidyl transferase AbiEii/AbiGii toxin family protein [Elusimicrobia bacterium]|nr:nucleotidyl transferase AbiEii/AbiGii toxin family protein [Elusimicrobiota bacterium]
MTSKEFLNKLAKSKKDLLQEFINILKKRKIKFCVIGGLAVNAYAEPVVSLDFDAVIIVDQLEDLLIELRPKYKIKKFPNSINIGSPSSNVRIQLQTDPRYQEFIKYAVQKNVLGYKLPVAVIEDVLQGKIWAALDEQRRPSKRQKDLADILRLMEAKKSIAKLVPASLKKKFLWK